MRPKIASKAPPKTTTTMRPWTFIGRPCCVPAGRSVDGQVGHDHDDNDLEEGLDPGEAAVPHVEAGDPQRIGRALGELDEDPQAVGHEYPKSLHGEDGHYHSGGLDPGVAEVELVQALGQVDPGGHRGGGQ